MYYWVCLARPFTILKGKTLFPGKVPADIKVVCESGVTRVEHN
jgi:hypothetical protein